MEEVGERIARRRRAEGGAPCPPCRSRNRAGAPDTAPNRPCRIDGVDADLAHVLDEGRARCGSKTSSWIRIFDRQRLARRHSAARAHPACQPASISRRRASRSRRRSRPEPSDVGATTASPKASSGMSPRNCSSNASSACGGAPSARELRFLEHRVGARIGVVEEVAVRPFEVEAHADRLARARIGELLAPLVQRPGLHGGRHLARELALDDAPVRDRREIVARRPGPRRELLAKLDVALLERLEGGIAVAVKLDADRIEMEEPAHDRQVARPVVLDAVIFDRLARIDAGRPCRAPSRAAASSCEASNGFSS